MKKLEISLEGERERRERKKNEEEKRNSNSNDIHVNLIYMLVWLPWTEILITVLVQSHAGIKPLAFFVTPHEAEKVYWF